MGAVSVDDLHTRTLSIKRMLEAQLFSSKFQDTKNCKFKSRAISSIRYVGSYP